MSKNKIDFALFLARTEWESWQCLQSHPQLRYEQKKFYASWDIPALMRLLLSNQNTLKTSLLKSLSNEEKQNLCLLIKWEPNLRLIAIVEFENAKKEELEQLGEQREILYQRAVQMMDLSRL